MNKIVVVIFSLSLFFCFTIGVEGLPTVGTFIPINTFHPPVVSGYYPVNGSTNIPVNVSCYVTVYDVKGDTMNISWYENTSGVWVLQQSNVGVSNGTFLWKYDNASNCNITYYWMVCVDDGIWWVNNTFHFTTVFSLFGLNISMIYPVNDSHVSSIGNLSFRFLGNSTIFYNITLSNGLNLSGSCVNDTVVVWSMIYSLVPDSYTVWVNVSDNVQELSEVFGFIIYKSYVNPLLSSNVGIIGVGLGIFGVAAFILVLRKTRKKRDEMVS